MADNKHYYWMKLKENFLDSDEMILLEEMPDGYLYSNLLMKLYLKSLKNEGKLMFKDRIPYSPTVLSKVTRHELRVVEDALKVFEDLGLIDILPDGAIYMLDIQDFIGQSTTEADRKKKYRHKIEQEKKGQISQEDDGQMSAECPDERTPETETEPDIHLKSDEKKTLDVRSKTEQEQVCADADSVDRLSVSAAADAEPPTGDLFSVAKLNEIVTKNKIGLSDEGVKIFYKEMQGSGWLLYEKPVEKQYIVRVLRAWAKKHVEFRDERLILRKEVEKNKDAREQYFKKHYGSSGYKTMLELDESIWETIKKYVSETRFEEEDDAISNSTIIKYCPREAFDEAQIKYLAEEQGIEEYELRSQNRVEVDKYLEDE